MATTRSTLSRPVEMKSEQVSGARVPGVTMANGVSRNAGISSMAGAASIHRHKKRANPETDRYEIAKAWQVEAYRQVNICGEARYAATLFASIAGRAEIGVSQPNTLNRKAVWVNDGPEVDAFAEVMPTVRERSKLIRDYMLHRTIAGECYLIARDRLDTDPGYVAPPIDPSTGQEYESWDLYLEREVAPVDPLDYEDEVEEALNSNPNHTNPIWEIVAVTEIQRFSTNWRIRHDNGNWITLHGDDPVIRMWNPDPENRREAWSPFRSLLPTLQEIEWETAHIFRQLRSRLISAGVWFLPDNLTFPAPPPESVEGGEEAIAAMNEAEQFMMSLAASATQELDAEEVSFPTIVMGDEAALETINQDKLIQFWSEIDDKAMILRSDAVRRFALGMDLPPEQVLGASGLAVSGTSGSAGSVNHWGVWANEEQTITAHIEPALDDLVGVLTTSVLRLAVSDTVLVIAYDTATLRLRQDRSKESIELYDRGLLKAEVAIRENGFDPQNDMMDDQEFRRWLLVRITGGSATPEQVQAAMSLLGTVLPVIEAPVSGNDGESEAAPGLPGRTEPRSLDAHPREGAPEGDHEHKDAPFSADFTALHAACEGLVLRALERRGNRLLNTGKRGKDRDRTTPLYAAHLVASIDHTVDASEFDFSFASHMLSDYPAAAQHQIVASLGAFCASLYNNEDGYTRAGLTKALEAV